MKRTEKNTQWHMRVILLLAGDIIAIMFYRHFLHCGFVLN